VIPEDYLHGGHAAYYAPQLTLYSGTDAAFREILKANLVVADSAAQITRIIHGPNVFYQPADDAPRQVRGTYTFWQLLVGLGIIALFVLVLNSIGPYWLAFMVSERERGMLEILLTSVSPSQFLMGKLLAAIFLMIFETVGPLLSLAVVNEGWRGAQPLLTQAGPMWNTVFKEFSPLPLDRLALMLATLFLGLLVYSTVYTLCGVLIQTPEAVGAVNGGLSTGLGVGGFLLLFAVLLDPGGPLAVGLSLFPFTAPIFMPVRLLLEPVPIWQTGLAVGLMALAIGLCLRWAGHLFQLRQWWWGANG
jgi:ABC-2 type transport system permease protein